MGWKRDDAGCSATHDGNARIARERYIMGGGENPVAVCGRPESFIGGENNDQPLPARNSKHPIDSSMLLDCYQVDTDGAVCAINALYSSDRRFRFPTVNASQNNGFTWTLATRNIQYGIPYAIRVTEVIGDALQSTDVFDLWKFGEQNTYESAQEVRMRFKVLPEKVPLALNVMYERQNKLQRINGEIWLFVGGELTQGSTSGDYEMSVSWLREAGIPAVPPPIVWDSHGQIVTGQRRSILPQVKNTLPQTNQSVYWHKPPFHNVFILPNESGNPEDEPYFSPFCPFALDETGFASVVGLIP